MTHLLCVLACHWDVVIVTEVPAGCTLALVAAGTARPVICSTEVFRGSCRSDVSAAAYRTQAPNAVVRVPEQLLVCPDEWQPGENKRKTSGLISRSVNRH